MLKNVLDKALDKYSLQGFELKEDGDDFLVLYHQDEEVARFTQLGAIPAFIQTECEMHLSMQHGYAGFTFEAATQ
jgi:hypothetical protein